MLTDAEWADYHQQQDQEQRNRSLAIPLTERARSLRMTPVDLAYAEHAKYTQDKNSPFYGMDPETFAQEVQRVTGSDRYQLLNKSKAVRGLQLAGNFVDSEMVHNGMADAAGNLARGMGYFLTDNTQTAEAFEQVGREMPTAAANLALMAIPGVGFGLSVGATSLDAFTDATEANRSTGSALGAAALAGITTGLLPATGRALEKVGASVAFRLAGENATKALSLMRSQLPSTGAKLALQEAATVTAVREAGQLTFGVGADVADVALFDPNRTLADLTKEEYLLPMLLSNGVTVLGQEAIQQGPRAIRALNSKEPPPVPTVGTLQVQGAQLPAPRSVDQYRQQASVQQRASFEFTDTTAKTTDLDFVSKSISNPLYTPEQYRVFGTDSDLHTTVAHGRANDIEQQMLNVTGTSVQTPAEWLGRMVLYADRQSLPLSAIKNVTQQMWNNVRAGSASDAEASARVIRFAQDETARTFASLPEEFRDNATLQKTYDIWREHIHRGTAQIVFASKQHDISAVLKNANADATDANLVIYKGGRQLEGEARTKAFDEHFAGIQQGVGEFNSTKGLLLDIAHMEPTKVVAGSEIRPEVANMFRDLVKGLDLDEPIHLITDADLAKPEFAAYQAAFRRPNQFGLRLKIEQGGRATNVIWSKGGQGNYDIVTRMHELGHIVQERIQRQFPEAVALLKSEADAKLANVDFSKLENLRQLGPNHPQFLREWSKLNKNPQYDFQEWFSNQFSKWALDKNAKPATVVDRYFKTVVDKLRLIWDKVSSVFTKPTKTFDQWMNQMSRKFYTNLVWNDDAIFRTLSNRYQLGDQATDMMARAFYNNPSPAAGGLMAQRLGEWHAKGRTENAEAVIKRASDDAKRLEDVAMPVVKPVELAQVKEVLHNPDPKTISPTVLKEVQRLFNEEHGADPYYFGNEVRTLHTRWQAGELSGQKGVPRAGGDQLLLPFIRRAYIESLKPVPSPMTLKSNGTIDNYKGQIRYFKDIGEANQAADGFRSMIQYAQHAIEVQSVLMKSGQRQYKVVFKFGEDSRRVSFDERYHNPEMDSHVNEVIGEIKTYSIDDLAMSTNPEAFRAFVQPKVTELAMGMQDGIDIAQVAAYTPTDFAAKMSKSIMRQLGDRTAPETLMRSLDRVSELAQSDVHFQQDLISIGKEFGYTGKTLDGFVEKFAQQLGAGKRYKDLVELAPQPVADVMREVANVVERYGKIGEFGQRVGQALGLNQQSLEQIKGQRNAATSVMTEGEGVALLTKLVKSTSEGGRAELDRSLARKLPHAVRVIYEGTFGGALHTAASNPMLKPFMEATSMEKRDQNRAINDTTIALHARDMNMPRADFAPDRAYVVVREDPKLDAAMRDLVLLENLTGKDVPTLMRENHPEFNDIMAKVPGDKKGKFMELRERMYKVNENATRLWAQETRQIDRLNIAKFLSRQLPDMPPDKAMAFVDTLYQLEPNKQLMAMGEAGLDEGLAQRVIRFKDELDGATSQAIARRSESNWYVSEQRFERFLVRFYNDKTGKSGAVSFPTRELAEQWKKAQPSNIKPSAKGVEDTEKFRGTRTTQDLRELLDSTIESKKAVLADMFTDTDDLAQVIGILDDINQGVNSGAIAQTKGTLDVTRKFAEGRETLDVFDQQLESVRRMSVGLTRARTDAIYSLYRHDKFFETPEGARQLRLADIHKDNVRMPDTEVGNIAGKLSFVMTMGTNVASMIQEAMTVPLIIAPGLRERGAGFLESFNASKKTVQAILKRTMTGKFDDPQWEQVINRAIRENTLTARHLVDIDEQRMLNDVGTRRIIEGGKTMERIGSFAEGIYKVSTKLYQPAAQFSGMTTILTGFDQARKMNPKGTFDEWYAAGINFHELMQGAHGKAGRPIGLFSGRSEYTRTMAQIANNLQSFANAQVGNMIRWAKDGYLPDPNLTPAQRKQARAAFNQYAAITIGAVGLTGLPLVGAISKLSEKLLGYNPEHELEVFLTKYLPGDLAENAFMTNFALRGSTYASGLPFDLQSRMSVGGLFAFNNYEGANVGKMFGVPGQIVQQGIEALGGFVSGQGMAESIDLVPAGMKRAVQLMVNDGKFVNNGHVMIDPTAAETAFAVLGFTPQRLRQQYDLNSARDYFDKKDSKVRKQVIDKSAELLNQGRDAEARAYINEKAAELSGLRPVRDTKQGLTKAAANRFAYLNTPNSFNPGRSAEAPFISALYPGSDQPNQTGLYLREIAGLNRLGQPTNPTMPALQAARQADSLMALDRSMPPSLAQTYARMFERGVLPQISGLGGDTQY